jgi:hypothetical protein
LSTFAGSTDTGRTPNVSNSQLVRQTLKLTGAPTVERVSALLKSLNLNPWSLASWLMLLSSAALLLIGSPKSQIERLACLIALLASFPAQCSLRNGADSILLLPVMAAFWLLLRKDRIVPAAISALPIALIRFEYLPFLLLPGLLVGGRRFLVAIVFALAVLLAGHTIAYSGEGLSALSRSLSLTNSFQSVEITRMDNVFGQLATILPNYQWAASSALLVLGAALLFLIYIWGIWYPNNRSTDNAFQLCAGTTTLLIPFTSMITPGTDYLLYFIPGCWILDWLKSNAIEPHDAFGFKLFVMSIPIISWLGQDTTIQNHAPWAKLLTGCGLLTFMRISRDLSALKDKALAKHLRGSDYNLGSLLVAANVVDEERVKAAAEFSRLAGVNLGQALVLTGCISRQQLEEAMLSQHLLKNKLLPVSKLRSTLNRLKTVTGS